ncbi:MAG: hypothetical protein KAK00_10630 [Nanoarchaeota archaeon]|nr:hypothetical protein [Nanoarchaeota archaeon]
MNLMSWMDEKIKNLRWFDISLTKLSVAAGILALAKLWAPILGLEWYWYALIGVIAAIRPMAVIFGK